MTTTLGVRAPTPRLVLAMLVVAVVASPVLVAPYLGLDRSASRIPVRSDLLYALLVVHVTTASTAILLGVAQLVPRLRARRVLHRWVGRAFLGLGVVAYGVTAVPLALATESGEVTRYGTLVPALGWLVCAGLGWRAARQRRYDEHRTWMVRTVALSFFALTTRLLVPLLLVAQVPFQQDRLPEAIRGLVSATIPYGQWLGWVVDLAVAELVLRRWRRAEGSAVLRG